MLKKVVKISFVLLLIISNVFLFSGCGKKEESNGKQEDDRSVYEAPLRNYMEGLKTKNIDLLLSAFPTFMQKMTQSDINTVYAEYEAQYGSNVAMEYQLGEATRINDEADLKVLAQQIKEYYPEADEIQISDAYIITVEVSIMADSQEEQSENGENSQKQLKKSDSQDFYVYKWNNQWYMF